MPDKIIKLILIIFLTPLLLFGVFIFLFSSFMCETRKEKDVLSPNGRYSIHIEDSNCGATTGYISDLIITDNEKLKRFIFPSFGNETVLTYEGVRTGVRNIKWLDNNNVEITTDVCRDIIYQADSWSGVNIHYKKLCI